MTNVVSLPGREKGGRSITIRCVVPEADATVFDEIATIITAFSAVAQAIAFRANRSELRNVSISSFSVDVQNHGLCTLDLRFSMT
jgi:hypothetical protein